MLKEEDKKLNMEEKIEEKGSKSNRKKIIMEKRDIFRTLLPLFRKLHEKLLRHCKR